MAQNYQFSDYLSISTNYWRTLAERYRGKVSVWQLFNEGDASHYRYFTELSLGTPGYLPELKSLLTAGRTVIREADPEALLTTNSTGYPMNDARQEDWFRYFDALSSSLDVVALDTYPADNVSEIRKLGDRVSAVKRRYAKPVYIAEVGADSSGRRNTGSLRGG